MERERNAAAPPKNIAIATNMWNLAINALGLEVGIRLADFVSVNVNGLYWHWAPSSSDSDSTLMGGGIGLQFFPTSGRTFKGFYIYPSVAYLQVKTKETVFGYSSEAKASTVGIGATFGYQWLFSFGMILRVGGGLVRYGNTESTTTNSLGQSVTVKGAISDVTLPNLDGHIGFAF